MYGVRSCKAVELALTWSVVYEKFPDIILNCAHAGSGEVYSFGLGQLGALGHGDRETRATPTLIHSLWGLAVVQVGPILNP
jgi:hypothetical protein